MNYEMLRGFNYQPGWGSTGYEIWRNFDLEGMRRELASGKRYFPGMNSIRFWLSHDAWLRNPGKFEETFEGALSIADEFELSVMPVLFNRWHDSILDYGGIYIDHFLPRASWVQGVNRPADFAESIVRAHATDSRIFSWDLCNEPFAYGRPPSEIPDVVDAEFAWLKSMYDLVKSCGATAPVTVGIHAGHGKEGIQQIEPISDILSIHPYCMGNHTPEGTAYFENVLDSYVQFSKDVNKPLIATETCWGAIDDAERVEIIHYTLTHLKKRGIGWMAYLLCHSLIADAHRVEFGPIGSPKNLSFIEADGSLRPGHEVFNDY